MAENGSPQHDTVATRRGDKRRTGAPGADRINTKQGGNGAGTKIRTRDLLITNQLLYQLSYAGNCA